MPFELPVFYKRFIGGAVYMAFMLSGLLCNYLFAFLILVSAIFFLCFREYYYLAEKFDTGNNFPKWLFMVVTLMSLSGIFFAGFSTAGIINLLPFLHVTNNIISNYPLFWILLLCLPSIILATTLLSPKNIWQAGIHSLIGMLYILLPLLLFIQLRLICIVIPLATVLMIWTNDTGAYFVGSFLGKTPLSAISPNKSWEGIIGGGILTIIIGFTIGVLTDKLYHIYIIYDWVVISIIVSICGPIGDLLQSKLKRLANVKDSGNLLPGHGGALDRLDSLIFTIPFVFCYAFFAMPHHNILLF